MKTENNTKIIVKVVSRECGLFESFKNTVKESVRDYGCDETLSLKEILEVMKKIEDKLSLQGGL